MGKSRTQGSIGAAFVSRKIFKRKNQNVVTKHIFVGMSCAAAALPVFFGLSIGGILFALEVTLSFGVMYFEHFIDAIFAGKIYLDRFQWLANCSSQANLGYCTSSSVMCQAQPYIIMRTGHQDQILTLTYRRLNIGKYIA